MPRDTVSEPRLHTEPGFFHLGRVQPFALKARDQEMSRPSAVIARQVRTSTDRSKKSDRGGCPWLGPDYLIGQAYLEAVFIPVMGCIMWILSECLFRNLSVLGPHTAPTVRLALPQMI